MKESYRYLSHEDIPTIPCGMVRERREMLLHLRSIHTIGNSCDCMSLQEMMHLLKEDLYLYPKHPEMYSEKRLKTLEKSPSVISMLPMHQLENIVRAGFFYSGTETTLTCFNCGCNAIDWQNDDDPWVRHAELQPKCPIIKRRIVFHDSGRRSSYSIIRRSTSCPEYAVCGTA